jgi:hypothetical protein
VSRNAARSGEEPNVFLDRQVWVETKTLRDVTEFTPHLVSFPPDIHACDLRPAARRMDEAAEHPNRRRFSRAIRAQKTEDRSGRDRERQIRDGLRVAVRFAQAFEKNGRFAHDFDGACA